MGWLRGRGPKISPCIDKTAAFLRGTTAEDGSQRLWGDVVEPYGASADGDVLMKS